MAIVYTVLAIVMTWPLARHLGTRLAADLGDPVFNCWVLMWTAGQVLSALHGDVGALTNFWNGNIFFPEPLTLTYSEHLSRQMLQILPVLRDHRQHHPLVTTCCSSRRSRCPDSRCTCSCAI